MKKLNLAMLTSLVAGNMIGSGIFLLPSTLARLGSFSLLSWLFTALGSFILAIIFSRMSVLLPKTGGAYAYAQYGLGNVIGFQTAYSYWIAIFAGNAAIALAGVSYLSVFFPILTTPSMACFVAILVIWILTALNLRGVSGSGLLQLITTILKLIPLLLIAILGWLYFDWQNLMNSLNVSSPKLSNFDLITQGATLTLWSFIGLESATVPAESVKNPKRDIPLATLLGTLIATVVYVASSTAIMGMIPNDQLQTSLSPFADAATLIFGNFGKWFIAAGAVIACFGSLNGWILLQGQIPLAAARDGLFPKIFAKENSFKVPGVGLIITSILTSLLLLISLSANLVTQFKVIILIATFANLIPYLYTSVVEILFIRKNKPIKIAAFFIALLGIFYSFWTMIGAGHDTLVCGALLLISSIPLYLFTKKSDLLKES